MITTFKIIAIVAGIIIFIIIIFAIMRKSKKNVDLEDDIVEQLRKLEGMLEDIRIDIQSNKNNFNTIVNTNNEIVIKLEEILRYIKEEKIDILSNAIPLPPATSYSIRIFYLDVFQKGFKENFGEKIYKCETIEDEPNKARFEINSLTNTTKNMFFNAGDYNKSLICKYIGEAIPGRDIKTVKKGILKHIGNKNWEPEEPIEVEFY